MNIRIMKLRPDVQSPLKKYEGDAGFDVFAIEDKLLWPASWHAFPLGFALELPHGWYAMIAERSGMARTKAIMTIGNIIDSTYRGECHAILYNGDPNNRHQIKAGDKIAQMIIMPCWTGTRIDIIEELSVTARGVGGFGSTGR